MAETRTTIGGSSALDSLSALVGAGVDLTLENGVDALATIDTSEALKRSGVHRGSAFGKNRHWPRQWDYQVEVLKEVVGRFPTDGTLETFDDLFDHILANDLSTPNGQDAAFETLVAHPAQLVELLSKSKPWRAWNAVWACVVSTPGEEDDAQLEGPAQSGYVKLHDVLTKRYGHVLSWLGYHPNSDTARAAFGGLVLDLVLGAASTPQQPRPEDTTAAIAALVGAFFTKSSS